MIGNWYKYDINEKSPELIFISRLIKKDIYEVIEYKNGHWNITSKSITSIEALYHKIPQKKRHIYISNKEIPNYYKSFVIKSFEKFYDTKIYELTTSQKIKNFFLKYLVKINKLYNFVLTKRK